MANLPELSIILLSIFAILGLTFLRRRTPRTFRSIPAFNQLYRLMGRSVEEGTRLHVSLGRGSLLTSRGGPSLAGLTMLRYLTERTSVGDLPPVATTGDPALVILAQDSLKAGYQAAAAEDLYQPGTGRLTGMTPFSYAAGVMPVLRDESISASLLVGGFGPEAALITDASLRAGSAVVGGTDDLSAQAILFASAREPLIGEELFAASAYLGAEPVHAASLTLQDILRWLVIAAVAVGAVLKLLGVL